MVEIAVKCKTDVAQALVVCFANTVFNSVKMEIADKTIQNNPAVANLNMNPLTHGSRDPSW